MKRFFIILMVCLSMSTISFGQTEEDFKTKIELVENKIAIMKSEIKTCSLRLKIDKTDEQALYVVSSGKEKLNKLEEDLSNAKKSFKFYKVYMKTLKEFNDIKLKFEEQMAIFRKID